MRKAALVVGITLAVALSACGGGSGDSAEVVESASGGAVAQAEESRSAAAPVESAAEEESAPEVIVAFGDSFTAGFGYYADGTEWTDDDFFTCVETEEGAAKNNPCSSNSTARSLKAPLEFSPDYGFGNQVSWAAQVASALGVTPETAAEQFANLAVSGSTGLDWSDDALTFTQLDGKNGLDAVASLNPSVILMSLGGNPTLGKVLAGETPQCEEFDRPVKPEKLKACFADVIEGDGTPGALRSVYTRLLDTTQAKVIILEYPKVLPGIGLGMWSPEALLVAHEALREAVTSAVEDIQGSHPEGDRLVLVAPEFFTGLPPGTFNADNCAPLAEGVSGVDGPSNQSLVTQKTFSEEVPESGYCPGDPLMISSDTGVHPNKAGYEVFARAALAALAK